MAQCIDSTIINAADHIVRVRNLEPQAAQPNDAISFPVNCIITCNLDDFVRRYHVFVCLAVSRCQQVTRWYRRPQALLYSKVRSTQRLRSRDSNMALYGAYGHTCQAQTAGNGVLHMPGTLNTITRVWSLTTNLSDSQQAFHILQQPCCRCQTQICPRHSP